MSAPQPHHKRTLLLWLVLGTLLIVPALAWRIHHTQDRDALIRPERTANGSYKYTNKLIGETSPYLLEHAHNPVNWYPWGTEALEKAKRENKPIFLSIGYSACHWCHVMAREDFEDEEIARLLNDHFVAIKVDREQRPDIDAQYMLAVQMLTGSGGWPLSVFLTPDRKPFFGGTYFPPDAFKRLLNQVVEVYTKQPDRVRAQADKVAAAIAAASAPTSGGKLPSDVLQQAVVGLEREFDPEQGGFAKQPKFPETPNLAFLLARYAKTGDKMLLRMVTKTLDHMAEGGIYDQLGGGFHRYSTDAIWRVPHFEKMLYDQAQLMSVYLAAYQITHTPRYRQVAEQTLDFVSREMRDKDGGFYSTIDADSEGEEGKFYLWTPDQVQAVLGDDAPLFDALYGVTDTGDLDGKSVLHVATSLEQVAKQHRLDPAQLARRVEAMRQKMLTARQKRVRPKTDDKILASWNGLMIAAYAQAYQVLGEEKYRQTAIEAVRFLMQRMMPNGQLRHSYRAGKAEVAGLLEDYAYSAYGLLALYEATHAKPWLDQAQALATRMVAQFGNAQSGGFYATASQGDLLARLKEGEDNALPSSNGVAALVLARLAAWTGQASWRAQAVQAIQAFAPVEERAPAAFPTLLTAHQMLGTSSPISTPSPIVPLQTTPVTTTPGSTVTVVLPIHVQQGWHINAHNPSANYLIATTLRLADANDVSLVRVQYPDGQKVRFAFSAEPLSVYQGQIVLKARLQLARSARPGRRTLHFTLHYQPCNDRACLAPMQMEIPVLLHIR